METRKVSQRAELVIKSAIIKPTHLEGRSDWSIVLSFDITLSFSYYSGPSVNRREGQASFFHVTLHIQQRLNRQIRRIYLFGNVIFKYN